MTLASQFSRLLTVKEGIDALDRVYASRTDHELSEAMRELEAVKNNLPVAPTRGADRPSTTAEVPLPAAR